MRRIVAVLLMLCLFLPVTTACRARKENDKLTVVCTVFPLYDWAREVIGDVEGVQVILLAQNGTDMHSYQPTAEDIIRLRSCDLLIRLGGTADGWVEDALRRAPSKTRRDLPVTELSTLVLREVSDESVAQGHEHGHDHTDHDHHEDCAVDEHIWLSLSNAKACVFAIADGLATADAENAERYRANGEAYAESLSALDGEYRALAEECDQPYLVVADRFPFIYLTEEYGIGYLAAFAGCSTDSSVDADTVIRLARTLDERALGVVVVTESTDGALAQSVLRATKQGKGEVVILDSLQSVTAKQLEEGKTYLQTMRDNLTALRRILLP